LILCRYERVNPELLFAGTGAVNSRARESERARDMRETREKREKGSLTARLLPCWLFFAGAGAVNLTVESTEGIS